MNGHCPESSYCQRTDDEMELRRKVEEFVKNNVDKENTTITKYEEIVNRVFSLINGTWND